MEQPLPSPPPLHPYIQAPLNPLDTGTINHFMPPKSQNERPVSELPSSIHIFRFFHLPLGQSLIFLPPFPLLPPKFFTNIWEQKRLSLILCTKAIDSGLYHASEGGEMQMIFSCHSQEPRELNDTPRSHSTSQARPAVLLPISSLPLCPPPRFALGLG